MIIDVSNELKIYRFNNGIKLIRPDQLNKIKSSKLFSDTGHTIYSIMNLPFPVYLENPSQITIRSNEITANVCGFESLNDFISNTWFDNFKQDTIIQKLYNHNKVIKNNFLAISDEHALRSDGGELNTLSVRMPWYDYNNEIIGLFGCSILLGKNPLAESLTQIAELGLLNLGHINHSHNYLGTNIDSVYLSNRELQCLRLTVRGMPAKQVAYELKLSQRTVEDYLQNIKNKMQVSSKAELIDKAINYFFQIREQ